MKRRSRRYQARFAPEQLETRALLAGNVLASFENGKLTLRGDGEDNGVVIDRGATQLLLTGVGTGPNTVLTTINSQFQTSFPYEDVTVLDVRMKSGRDTVQIDIEVKGDIVAKMGSGNDLVLVEGNVSGNVDAKMGSGADFIWLSGVNIGRDVTAVTESVFVDNVVIEGDGSLKHGVGTDSSTHGVAFETSTVRGDVTVRGGRRRHSASFIDTIVEGDVNISLGGGQDLVLIDGTSDFLGEFTANGGGGRDVFENDGPEKNNKNFEIFN